jgi:hypothetical protein
MIITTSGYNLSQMPENPISLLAPCETIIPLTLYMSLEPYCPREINYSGRQALHRQMEVRTSYCGARSHSLGIFERKRSWGLLHSSIYVHLRH